MTKTEIMPAVSIALVSYVNGREPDTDTYSYFNRINALVDDYVLVPINNEHRLVLGRIRRIDDVTRGHRATRELAGVVTGVVQGYYEKLELRDRRAKAMERLEEIKKRQTDLAIYRHLAETDPEARELVEMLEKTQGQVVDEFIDEAPQVTTKALKRKPGEPSFGIKTRFGGIDE